MPETPFQPEPSERHIQLTAEALRVLAHPLRARLLSSLRRAGPGTATDLAGRLSTNTGATSYHLRKLAEVDLVVEVGEEPGRRRRWQAAQLSHSWTDSELPDDPDALAASSWLRRHYWQQYAERMAQWEEYRPEWPVEWRDAAGVSDALLDLTVDELRQFTAEVYEVVERYRDRPSSQRSGAVRRVAFHTSAMPDEPTDPA